MRRELGQLSLADGLVEGGAGRNRQLEKIAALVDWTAFERLLGDVYAAPVGRPSYGPVVLLKCLLLQQWYRLSDPGLEEALSDRLSFRRFVGLALADPVPDHSTLSRFRSELSRRGLAERLLAELNRQLDAKGLMVKSGTLIDASLVEADCRRPHKGAPVEERSDQDASWNAMPEQPLFGYKMHLAVDHGSGLVRRAILTPATSRTSCRSSLWSRATSARYTRIGAMTVPGIGRAWSSRASPTASWPATTGSGRSMPPGAPATGCSRRCAGRSSAPSGC
jgi:transposase, IS5 family